MNEEYKLKFTKLDKRFRGYEEFSHYVTVTQPVKNYVLLPDIKSWVGYMALRDICVSTWGMSCERELYIKAKHEQPNLELNKHWAWHTDLNNKEYRIYLKSDEERAWLLLKW